MKGTIKAEQLHQASATMENEMCANAKKKKKQTQTHLGCF